MDALLYDTLKNAYALREVKVISDQQCLSGSLNKLARVNDFISEKKQKHTDVRKLNYFKSV